MIEKYLPNNFLERDRNAKTYNHSMLVANAAKLIAEKCGLNAELAFLCGELHDIGKFEGIRDSDPNRVYRHPRIGYELLKDTNSQIAKVCIAHPFPVKNIVHVTHFCKGDENEISAIWQILSKLEYDKYIELIQLCDKMSGIDKYITVEDKIEWYRAKRGIPEHELKKYYEEPLTIIKKKFESMGGIHIYKLLDINSYTVL